MATYYRWRKSTVAYRKTSIPIPINDRRYIYGYSGRMYYSKTEPSLDTSTGMFTWPTNSYANLPLNTTSSGTIYYSPVNGTVDAYIQLTDGQISAEKLTDTLTSFIISSGTCYTVQSTSTAGTSQGYVYSTSSSAYPNGGVSGSYYYDQRTTVTSPTAPTGLTYPNPITTPTVTVSWNAATSNVPDYSVSQYEVSYSTNGKSWTMAGTTTSTSYSFDIPAGTTSITFRVRARDTNNQWGNYVTGTASQVLLAPTLTVPQMVMQGQQATISWTAIEGADSYTVQRKANTDAAWTQVYSGANLSYTETVGTWTSLQYRVQAVFGETAGGWATSGDIQIVSASALVISGTDGDLGILTNDVQYSISSDQTSPTIDATVEVNGGEYAAFQATSGQTYTVSVLDLPTGTGSIVITASTEVSSSPVTVTRTWTYSKTAPTFAEQGGLAQLTQQGQNIWAKTIAEAVRTPGIWGGNLGLALSKLANAVLYDPETGGFNSIGGADATIPMVSIETGSYVGTGTYGSGNPNSLTFNGSPKIVFMKQSPPSGSNPGKADVFLIYPGTSFVFDGNRSMLEITVQWEQNKVKWYSNAANTQFNENGETYVYAAITIPGGAT